MVMSLEASLLGLSLLLSTAAAEAPEQASQIEQVDVVTGASAAATPGVNGRIEEFRKRALMLKRVSVAEAMSAGKKNGPGGMMATPRANVIVVNGDGKLIPDEQLAQMVKNKNLAQRYTALTRQEAMLAGVRVGGIGLLLASLPVGALLGVLVGGGIGIPLAIASGTMMTALLGAGIGLGIGALAGVVLGSMVFATYVLVGATVLFYSYYTRTTFYAGAVREHNTELAQELGVNPAEVGVDYFPTDKPVQK